MQLACVVDEAVSSQILELLLNAVSVQSKQQSDKKHSASEMQLKSSHSSSKAEIVEALIDESNVDIFVHFCRRFLLNSNNNQHRWQVHDIIMNCFM